MEQREIPFRQAIDLWNTANLIATLTENDSYKSLYKKGSYYFIIYYLGDKVERVEHASESDLEFFQHRVA
jgi:hypothetical protein